jgi:predicted N-acetyltransferase YhbS
MKQAIFLFHTATFCALSAKEGERTENRRRDCVIIRLEQPKDYSAVERLTLAAFKTFTFQDGSRPPQTDEHYLVHIMRGIPAFVPELDFVGETGGEIACNIMYTESKVVRPDGSELATLTFGPVSVKPELHGQGLGAEIIRHSIDRARELGYGAVIIAGHPGYYPRFGFRPASDFNLTMPDGSTMEPLMALEIIDGCLGMDGGTWHEDGVYEIDQSAFREWDAQFER